MEPRVDRAQILGEQRGALERIAPGLCDPILETQHLTRYRWAAGQVRGAHVLDVACGTGYGASELWRGGASSVVSLDISVDALRFGRDVYGIWAIAADAHYLPFAPDTFDVAVSFETLEHLEDPERFLGELRRVLRKAGSILLSTPNRILSAGDNPYHRNEFSRKELLEIAENAGLRVMRILGQGWRLNAALWQEIRGFRRLAYEVERRTSARGFSTIPGADPLFWWFHAVKP